jgi:predicted DNA-binding transcriptional regulator AlpA
VQKLPLTLPPRVLSRVEARQRGEPRISLCRWPRGLSRTEAATYVGVGTTLFDGMVADGRMPRPKRINSRKAWDRFALDAAFASLPDDADAARKDVFDEVA